MLTRRPRRIAALVAMATLVFAQLSLAAHACPLQAPVAPVAVAHAPAQTSPAEHMCAGGAGSEPVSTSTNVCEVHCTDGVMLPASPDVPAIVLAALPAPDTAPVAVTAHHAVARTPRGALPGAPPLTLKYCRLLN